MFEKKRDRFHSCSDCLNKEFTQDEWKEHLREIIRAYKRKWDKIRRQRLKPAPKKVPCWRCEKEFEWEIYFNSKGYTEKNRWDYWTEKEEDKDKYVCNACLVALYRFQKSEFRNNIKNQNKRAILARYAKKNENIFSVIHSGIFDCDKENCGQRITLYHVMNSRTGEEFLCES